MDRRIISFSNALFSHLRGSACCGVAHHTRIHLERGAAIISAGGLHVSLRDQTAVVLDNGFVVLLLRALDLVVLLPLSQVLHFLSIRKTTKFESRNFNLLTFNYLINITT